jgi:hypothetical protein
MNYENTNPFKFIPQSSFEREYSNLNELNFEYLRIQQPTPVNLNINEKNNAHHNMYYTIYGI